MLAKLPLPIFKIDPGLVREEAMVKVGMLPESTTAQGTAIVSWETARCFAEHTGKRLPSTLEILSLGLIKGPHPVFEGELFSKSFLTQHNEWTSDKAEDVDDRIIFSRKAPLFRLECGGATRDFRGSWYENVGFRCVSGC